MSPWISLIVGTVVIVGGVLWLGRKVSDSSPEAKEGAES
jgi:hypothetical protein